MKVEFFRYEKEKRSYGLQNKSLTPVCYTISEALKMMKLNGYSICARHYWLAENYKEMKSRFKK